MEVFTDTIEEVAEPPMRYGCGLDLPYPKVSVRAKNLEYARILSKDFAGMVSELTAITQYSYGHFVLEETAPEISETLMCIGMTEMKHFDLLGHVIVALGGDPKFYSLTRRRPVYWDGRFVDYAQNPQKVIMDNINGEIKAIEEYKKSIALIDDPNVDAILRRIILDEEHHIKILTELYNKYK